MFDSLSKIFLHFNYGFHFPGKVKSILHFSWTPFHIMNFHDFFFFFYTLITTKYIFYVSIIPWVFLIYGKTQRGTDDFYSVN